MEGVCLAGPADNFPLLKEPLEALVTASPFNRWPKVVLSHSFTELAPGPPAPLSAPLATSGTCCAGLESPPWPPRVTRYYPDQPSFSYWQDKKNRDLEVDLIAEIGDRLVPFEVKYQDAQPTASKLKGLRLFLEEKRVAQGYVITQRWEDFGLIDAFSARKGREGEMLDAKIVAIPAPLACFWLSD